jgi:glucose-1-phosphate thymidylyltransferase
MPQKGVLVFGGAPPASGFRCGTTHVHGLELVANRPIAQHVLEAMTTAGVSELVVAGPADVLIDVRAGLSRTERIASTDYAISPAGSDLLAALQAAAPLVGAAPCIVHVGDGLLAEPLTQYVSALEENSLDLIVLREASPAAFGSTGRQRRAGANCQPQPVCDVGVGVFGPGAFREACRVAVDGQTTGLGSLARHLSDHGAQVQVCEADGWRRYRGSPEDLLEVNRVALDLLPPGSRHPARGENRIEGRAQIDPSAVVTTSVIVGPVVVGPGAEVANAYIGPYTSIGAGARIEGVEIERSIILPGASVMHVGGRLVSSLVGRGAHIFRDFSLPRAIRLYVGEGDEVALC